MAEQTPVDMVLARRARVDSMVEQLAAELRVALKAAARELRPFPMFPETETQAVEAEPGGAAKAEFGCIVVCPDGELYEFTMQYNFAPGTGEISKNEDTREVRLAPHDYIPYAYNALRSLTQLLAGRTEADGGARV